jgi:hydroxypyruvate isomerase
VIRYAVNLSILFPEVPLLQRPAAAREAGFTAVEFWWPFPEAVPADRDVDAFVRAVQDAGVALVGLNFFAGDMPGGDRGLVSWPARSTEFCDNLDVTGGAEVVHFVDSDVRSCRGTAKSTMPSSSSRRWTWPRRLT